MSSEKSSGTTSQVTMVDAPDWDLKKKDEGGGREMSFGAAVTRSASSSQPEEKVKKMEDEDEEDLSPVEDLKRRLSMWGESASDALHYDNEVEEGSEYELLLDPNLPEVVHPDLPEAVNPGFRFSDTYSDDVALKQRTSSDGNDDDENSPYPEVRAAVRNYDEDVPCNTVRAWVIGLTLVFVGASMNTLFSLRQPSISLGTLVAQIIAWPLGHGWAKVLPTRQFDTNFIFWRLKWSLNPGPFNIKEHSIIVVMAGVSFSVAYATDIILAQVVFYKQDFGILFQLLLTISTQSLGYGIAGMMRKFLGEFFIVLVEASIPPFLATTFSLSVYILTLAALARSLSL